MGVWEYVVMTLYNKKYSLYTKNCHKDYAYTAARSTAVIHSFNYYIVHKFWKYE